MQGRTESGGVPKGSREGCPEKGAFDLWNYKAFLSEGTAEAKVREHALENTKMNMAELGL